MAEENANQKMLPSIEEVQEDKPQNTKKKRGGRPTSKVWDHFSTFFDKVDKVRKAKCNYCGKTYFSDPKINGTSSLTTHLKQCKKLPCSSDLKQSQLSLQPICEEGGEVMGGLSNWRFDQDLCRKKLNEMIIKDELAFKIVEEEGFREFVATLQPKFKIQSRWTVSRDCYQLYLNEKEKLRDFFKNSGQHVCITTDSWTSLQKLNYICITAHFIDKNWVLNKRIINFCTIASHRGEEMARQLDACLRDWLISKVFSVTVDNASSNDTCITFLKNKLTSRDCSLVNGKFLHMRCVAHIVNLIVGDGLKEINDSIKKIRDAVRYVRQSPARLVRFKECCEEENIECKSLLCLDVPTRWNSTYLMLNIACKFEKAFEQFELKDPYFYRDLEHGAPSDLDWAYARKMTVILSSFYNLTIRISGSLYVTSNDFFHEISTMSCLLNEWIKSGDKDLSSMGMKMKAKFDKYWGDPNKMNKLIFLAVVVDPRYKYEFLEYALIEMYRQEVGLNVAAAVKGALNELYEVYKVLYQPQSGASVQDGHVDESEFPDLTNETSHYLGNKFKKQKIQNGEISSKNDIDVYLRESVEVVGKEFKILDWWKLNEQRLPVLSQIALGILSVPISTIASESAFSAGMRVLDPFRSSLTPKIVETLICTQDWLRRSNQLISIEEDLDGVEKLEAMRNLSINDVSESSQSTMKTS